MQRPSRERWCPSHPSWITSCFRHPGDGLRLVVAGYERTAAKGERVMPRISTAGGGLMPGIDLTDSAALEEMDDLDTIDRLKGGR